MKPVRQYTERITVAVTPKMKERIDELSKEQTEATHIMTKPSDLVRKAIQIYLDVKDEK